MILTVQQSSTEPFYGLSTEHYSRCKMTSDQVQARVVIITGISSTSCLSRHTAHAFAEAGASKLALLGPDEENLDIVTANLKSEHPALTILPQTVDITSPESLGLASHRIRSELGAWDVFVHHPWAFTPSDVLITKTHRTTIRGSDDEIWWSFFKRNVRSLHFIARHFFPKMTANPTFINIAEEPKDTWSFEHRDSAETASALAAARVMDYLARENEKNGLKAVNVWAGNYRTWIPDDATTDAEFVVWCVSKRSKLAPGIQLESHLGIDGYTVLDGKLEAVT